MCKNCLDTGYLFHYADILTKRGIEKCEVGRTPCLCKIWEDLKYYPKLSVIKNYDIPQFKKNYTRFLRNNFMVFVNGPVLKFHSIVKHMLMFDTQPFSNKLVISSNEFVEQFFLPRDDFKEKRVSDSSYYDRIFINFESGVIRPSTQSVLFELLSYRVNSEKSIWIYAERGVKLSKEYCTNMATSLMDFKYFDLKTNNFVKGETDDNSKKTAQQVNDDVAKR